MEFILSCENYVLPIAVLIFLKRLVFTVGHSDPHHLVFDSKQHSVEKQ